MKVSVIVPVYNAEPYLGRCLDSVCGQAMDGLEVICVNDASTDGSLSVLREYASRYPFVTVIDRPVNGGESAARNDGLRRATGEYLAFVDNDDTVDPDFFRTLYAQAKAADADISKGGAVEVSYAGEAKEVSRRQHELIRRDGRCRFLGLWWSAIYRTELVRRNCISLPEGFSLGGDLLFLVKAVVHAESIVVTDEAAYRHILRRDSGDGERLSAKKVESALSVMSMIFDELNLAHAGGLLADREYDVMFVNFFRAVEYVARKAQTAEDVRSCALNMIGNWKKSRRRAEQMAFAGAEWGYVMYNEDDAERVVKLLTDVCRGADRIFLALREKVRRHA